MKKKMKFDKYITIATGDEYFCLGKPEEKDIDGVKYFQVTPDFHRAAWIRADALKKNGNITYEMNV